MFDSVNYSSQQIYLELLSQAQRQLQTLLAQRSVPQQLASKQLHLQPQATPSKSFQ